MKKLLEMRVFMWGAGGFAIFLYFCAIVSGAIIFNLWQMAFVSIGAIAITAILFSRTYYGVLPIILMASFFQALFGGTWLWTHAIGFGAAAILMKTFFKKFIKHHAPIADALLIGLGVYTWLFMIGILQMAGFWIGFFPNSASGTLELAALLTTIPVTLGIAGVLILISNYSKYGALLRP